MEPNVQRLLNDKLYDKRKVGALEYVFPPFLLPASHHVDSYLPFSLLSSPSALPPPPAPRFGAEPD